MSEQTCIAIPNSMDGLATLAKKAQAFLESCQAPPRAAYATELTLEEMVTNIIKYGYDDTLKHEILVRMAADKDFLTLVVEDDGHEFDPTAAPDPDTTKPLSERKIGGLGIHLVRSMVENMTYRREGGRNFLQVRIPLVEAAQ
ncbi:MAG TPA: ATP-binding protein [Candidatus Brocadiia bacterium]|nr:ATP-binding protein [Candidatus Brocadiia bacterium]